MFTRARSPSARHGGLSCSQQRSLLVTAARRACSRQSLGGRHGGYKMEPSTDLLPSNGFVPVSIPLPPVPGVPAACHVLYLRRHASTARPAAGGDSGRGDPPPAAAGAPALFIANLPPNFTTLDVARLVRLPDPPAPSRRPATALAADTPDGGRLVVGALADARGRFARVTFPPRLGPTAVADILRSPAAALDTAVITDALTAHWRSAGGPGVWLAP